MNSSFSKLKKSSLITAITLALVLSGCKTESEAEDSIATVRPVIIETVNNVEVKEFFFNGTVAAADRAELSFRHSGRVIELLVSEGDEVEKGQLLARLDSTDAETALLSARSERENTRVEFQRAKTLYERQKSISKSQFDEIALRYKLADNRFKEAQNNLNDTALKAPFSGVVSRKFVEQYSMVQSNESIVAIHDLSNLEVLIDVPESLMTEASPETELFAVSRLYPGKHFPLSVVKYETETDPSTKTYAVTLNFDNLEGASLLPGMNVRVVSTWETDQSTAVNVPLTAVKPDNLGNQYVWIVNDSNSIEKRIVKTGALVGERIQVLSKLKAGEKVVVSGTNSLTEGLEVRPVAKEAF